LPARLFDVDLVTILRISGISIDRCRALIGYLVPLKRESFYEKIANGF
jgi:hypothetical protein